MSPRGKTSRLSYTPRDSSPLPTYSPQSSSPLPHVSSKRASLEIPRRAHQHQRTYTSMVKPVAIEPPKDLQTASARQSPLPFLKPRGAIHYRAGSGGADAIRAALSGLFFGGSLPTTPKPVGLHVSVPSTPTQRPHDGVLYETDYQDGEGSAPSTPAPASHSAAQTPHDGSLPKGSLDLSTPLAAQTSATPAQKFTFVIPQTSHSRNPSEESTLSLTPICTPTPTNGLRAPSRPLSPNFNYVDWAQHGESFRRKMQSSRAGSKTPREAVTRSVLTSSSRSVPEREPTPVPISGLAAIINIRDEVARKSKCFKNDYANWNDKTPLQKQSTKIEGCDLTENELRWVYKFCEQLTVEQIKGEETIILSHILGDAPDMLFEDAADVIEYIHDYFNENNITFFNCLVAIGQKIQDETAGNILPPPTPTLELENDIQTEQKIIHYYLVDAVAIGLFIRALDEKQDYEGIFNCLERNKKNWNKDRAFVLMQEFARDKNPELRALLIQCLNHRERYLDGGTREDIVQIKTWAGVPVTPEPGARSAVPADDEKSPEPESFHAVSTHDEKSSEQESVHVASAEDEKSGSKTDGRSSRPSSPSVIASSLAAPRSPSQVVINVDVDKTLESPRIQPPPTSMHQRGSAAVTGSKPLVTSFAPKASLNHDSKAAKCVVM